MEVVSALNDIPDRARGAVVAVGNFDGVHRGHRALLDLARARAQALGRPFAVLTFEPHPRSLFQPDAPPFRITPGGLKRDLLAAAGVDVLVELPFDWAFASQSADHFAEAILKRALGGGPVYVGRDFRFGQLRRGDAGTMRAAGVEVVALDGVADGAGQIFSSSRVREKIRAGDMDGAADDLGWAWEIRGRVVAGDRRGREIGYPTANLALGETIHPDYGVYACAVQILEEGVDSPWRPAATNIGIRPMFEVPVGQVEAHILDFDGDLYGRTLRVRPVRRLRGEARFDSLEALVRQIDQDCADVRAVLEARSLPL